MAKKKPLKVIHIGYKMVWLVNNIPIAKINGLLFTVY